MFKKNKEENQDNQVKKYEIQGKFYNLKLIKIIGAILVLIVIYNIFKSDSKVEKVETINKEKTQDVAMKLNPYQTSYSNIADKSYSNTSEVKEEISVQKSYNDISNIESSKNNTSTQTTNYKVISTMQNMSEDQKEKLRQLEEQADQAKKSPVAFQLYNNKQDGENKSIEIGSNFLADYDQNRQGSKKNFLFNETQKELYSTSEIVKSISPYEIKTGDFFPAVVETAMNSDIYSKVIIARISQNIYDTVTGKYLLIPQGTTLTGVYDSNITWGQDRLLVIWQQLRFPNGDMLRLDNMQGVDMIGQAGISGRVNHHFATLLKGVLLSSAMGAATAITTSNEDNWRSQAGEAAGLSIVQIGDKYTTKALERQPTIMIKAGDKFNVMVHSNLVLKPYKK